MLSPTQMPKFGGQTPRKIENEKRDTLLIKQDSKDCYFTLNTDDFNEIDTGYFKQRN